MAEAARGPDCGFDRVAFHSDSDNRDRDGDVAPPSQSSPIRHHLHHRLLHLLSLSPITIHPTHRKTSINLITPPKQLHTTHHLHNGHSALYVLPTPCFLASSQTPLFVWRSEQNTTHRTSQLTQCFSQTSHQSSHRLSPSAPSSTTSHRSPSSAQSSARPTARHKPPTALRSSSSQRRPHLLAPPGELRSSALPSSHMVLVLSSTLPALCPTRELLTSAV